MKISLVYISTFTFYSIMPHPYKELLTKEEYCSQLRMQNYSNTSVPVPS